MAPRLLSSPPTTTSWTPSPSPATARASGSRCWLARRWPPGGSAGEPGCWSLAALASWASMRCSRTSWAAAASGSGSLGVRMRKLPERAHPPRGAHVRPAVATRRAEADPSSRHRRVLLVLVLVWPVLVGISRVHLERHWPSDVLGAYVFGAALLIAMAWVWPKVAPVRSRNEYGAGSGPVDTVRSEPSQPVRPPVESLQQEAAPSGPVDTVRPEPVEGLDLAAGEVAP